MQSTAFAVADEPYLIWESDLQERTREFLEGFDVEYFSYLLKVHTEAEDENRSAVAIRHALHHANETLFALLGALVQAPDCPYAWIARCKNVQLRAVVRRVCDGDPTLLCKFQLNGIGWGQLAKLIFANFEPGTEHQQKIVDGFSGFWARMARELLSETNVEEYNASKHGFRTRPGGFEIKIGPAATSGDQPPEKEMKSLGKSKFGAMFYKVDRIEQNGGRHLSSRRMAVNWSFERDALLLQLVQMSIQNTIAALKIANKIPPNTCQFVWPSDEDAFNLPWKHSPGLINATFSSPVDPESLPMISRTELTQRLRKMLKAGG